MKARDYKNPLLLYFEEYSVRETAHPGAPSSSMNDRELQGMGPNHFDGRLDCLPRSRQQYEIGLEQMSGAVSQP